MLEEKWNEDEKLPNSTKMKGPSCLKIIKFPILINMSKYRIPSNKILMT